MATALCRVFGLFVILAVSVPPASPASAALPAPAGYEHAVSRLPARHWALVRSAAIDRSSGGQARRATMSVHMTPYRTDSQLHHEVGHLVAYADPALERDWRERFWPRGKPLGTPVSRYARTNDREDFAVAYEELIEHGCLSDRERERFLRDRVFRAGELGACST